eukprot:jgi/Mesvir1/19247/Mv03497-RA.1
MGLDFFSSSSADGSPSSAFQASTIRRASWGSRGYHYFQRTQGKMWMLLLVWTIICTLVLLSSLSSMDRRGVDSDEFARLLFMYYHPFILMVFSLWLFGINLYVFRRTHIRYEAVFEVDPVVMNHRSIWELSSLFSAVLFTSAALFAYAYSAQWTRVASAQPVLLFFLLPTLAFFPADVLHSSLRGYFIQAMRRLCLPLSNVTFFDFVLADVLTSLAKAVSDLERCWCRMATGPVLSLLNAPDGRCGSDSWMIPAVLSLPYGCRFCQCIVQYQSTHDKAHLANAAKYATSLPVIFISAFFYHVAEEAWFGFYYYLWLFCCGVNSSFSYFWDIDRDWSLTMFKSTSKGSATDAQHPFLRRELLYRRYWPYYLAITVDALLRATWLYKLSSHLRANEMTTFFVSVLEVLRRWQWMFFRVENECRKRALVHRPLSAVEAPARAHDSDNERPPPLLLTFKTPADKISFLRRRKQLEKTLFTLDDDLTLAQQQRRRELWPTYLQLRQTKAGQPVYWKGAAIYVGHKPWQATPPPPAAPASPDAPA